MSAPVRNLTSLPIQCAAQRVAASKRLAIAVEFLGMRFLARAAKPERVRVGANFKCRRLRRPTDAAQAIVLDRHLKAHFATVSTDGCAHALPRILGARLARQAVGRDGQQWLSIARVEYNWCGKMLIIIDAVCRN